MLHQKKAKAIGFQIWLQKQQNVQSSLYFEINGLYLSYFFSILSQIGSVCELLNPCGDKYCADACNHLGYKCFQCNETKNVLPVEPFCKNDGMLFWLSTLDNLSAF